MSVVLGLTTFMFMVVAVIFAVLWYFEMRKNKVPSVVPTTSLSITDPNLLRFQNPRRFLDVLDIWMVKESDTDYYLLIKVMLEDYNKINEALNKLQVGGAEDDVSSQSLADIPVTPISSATTKIATATKNIAYNPVDNLTSIQKEDLKKLTSLLEITLNIKGLFKLELNNNQVTWGIPLRVISRTTDQTNLVINTTTIKNLQLTSNEGRDMQQMIPEIPIIVTKTSVIIEQQTINI